MHTNCTKRRWQAQRVDLRVSDTLDAFPDDRGWHPRGESEEHGRESNFLFFLLTLLQFPQLPLTVSFCHACSANKNYIFAKTWNRTYALNFYSKMLTDEIMDQIEMKTGVSSSASRTKANNSRHDEDSNTTTSKKTTLLTSLELHGGTETAEQPAVDTKETTRAANKRRASEARVDVRESADVDTVVEQFKNDIMTLTKKECQAKSRSGHDFGNAEQRQNHGNTRRHFVYDDARKQRTTREGRSKDHREHERT